MGDKMLIYPNKNKENTNITSVDGLVSHIFYGDGKYFVNGEEDGLNPYFVRLNKGQQYHLGFSFDTKECGDVALVYRDERYVNSGRHKCDVCFDTFSHEDLRKLAAFALENIGNNCAICGVSGSFYDTCDNDDFSLDEGTGSFGRNVGLDFIELGIFKDKIIFDLPDNTPKYVKGFDEGKLYVCPKKSE